MRLNCPNCGIRDSREFTCRGSAKLLERPAGDAGAEAFHDYVHIRDNVCGRTEELWHHAMGCSMWLKVVRNTVTHEVISVAPARGGAS